MTGEVPACPMPHPGFVVLGSPLVTYRKPIHYKRHGELEADEKVIAGIALDQAFYKHLAGLGERFRNRMGQ